MEIPKFTCELKKNILSELKIKKLSVAQEAKNANSELTNKEFLKLLEFKYSLRVYVNKSLYYTSENVEANAKPLDIDIDLKKSKCQIKISSFLVVSNKIIKKKHIALDDEVVEEDGNESADEEVKDKSNKYSKKEIEEVNKALGLGDGLKNDEFDLLKEYIHKKFAFKFALDELTPVENYFCQAHQSYGQTNYLKSNDNIESCHIYDINAEHNYILSCLNFIPLRRGNERLIKDVSEIDKSKIGLYAIKFDFNHKFLKYFKPISKKKICDKKGYKIVSSYFINLLEELGVSYEMVKIDNIDCNAIEYNLSDCVNGNELFADDIAALYKLKKDGNKTAGAFLHKLFGFMSRRIKYDIKIESKEDFYFYGTPTYNLYSPFARMKFFIYDMCRVNMITYIKHAYRNKNPIYRIKADSIITQKPINKKYVSGELGMMKDEGEYKNISFKHVNDTSYKNANILKE